MTEPLDNTPWVITDDGRAKPLAGLDLEAVRARYDAWAASPERGLRSAMSAADIPALLARIAELEADEISWSGHAIDAAERRGYHRAVANLRDALPDPYEPDSWAEIAADFLEAEATKESTP